ncbi:MAG: helix-turn-helix transcriptional regulator [Rhodobacteraceae bacterium]|nr:helix-turn-helix transcriptional regulator [Paracoccaceae bacterium]
MKLKIDEFIGKNIRKRRIHLGMTQTDLANAIGVTFQQVQKYESGFNRVSSSRLWEIACALKTSVSSFFEGLGGVGTDVSDRTDFGDLADRPEARALIQKFRKLPQEQRRALLNLAKSLEAADK